MNWFTSSASKVAIIGFALIALQGYGFLSLRSAVDERMTALDRRIEEVRAFGETKQAQVVSDLEVITGKMGSTAQELQQARSQAEQLKAENARTAQRLRTQLAAKADSKVVSQVRNEAVTKLAEVQKDAATKIGAVSGEVQVVRTDLEATRQELAASRKDIGDVRTAVARNASELAALRLKGERDYIEFDMRKSNQLNRIADVQVQLKKTDVKRQTYTVVIHADDKRIERKDRRANEPVTFLVGDDRLRYEFVVNSVDKNRIRGYLSTPKDGVLSAEGPSTVQRAN